MEINDVRYRRQRRLPEPSDEESSYLASLYYDISKTGSYRGPVPLYKLVKRDGKMPIPMGKIRSWLATQPVYTLFKRGGQVGLPRQSRNKIEAYYVGDLFQFDVMILDPNSGNKNYNPKTSKTRTPVLIGADTFSRFMFHEILEQEDGKNVVKGLEKMFSKYSYQPKKAFADSASYHKAKPVKSFFKGLGTHLYLSNSEKHASLAERFIRIIRNGLARYFSANNTADFSVALPAIVRAYNESVCRMTKERPMDVFSDARAARKAYRRLYVDRKKRKRKPPRPSKTLPEVGEYVRISRLKYNYEKETPSRGVNSQELYRVRKVSTHLKRPMVFITDLRGEDIKGGFYTDELVVVKNCDPKEAEYEVEDIEPKKVKYVKKVKLVRVKFAGYKRKEWIPEANIRDVEINKLVPGLLQ